MLTCKDASRLISEAQDRELRFGERWGLRIHLWICVNCRRFERQMGLLRKALRTVAENNEQDPSLSDLSPEARERIRSKLKQQ